MLCNDCLQLGDVGSGCCHVTERERERERERDPLYVRYLAEIELSRREMDRGRVPPINIFSFLDVLCVFRICKKKNPEIIHFLFYLILLNKFVQKNKREMVSPRKVNREMAGVHCIYI